MIRMILTALPLAASLTWLGVASTTSSTNESSVTDPELVAPATQDLVELAARAAEVRAKIDALVEAGRVTEGERMETRLVELERTIARAVSAFTMTELEQHLQNLDKAKDGLVSARSITAAERIEHAMVAIESDLMRRKTRTVIDAARRYQAWLALSRSGAGQDGRPPADLAEPIEFEEPMPESVEFEEPTANALQSAALLALATRYQAESTQYEQRIAGLEQAVQSLREDVHELHKAVRELRDRLK